MRIVIGLMLLVTACSTEVPSGTDAGLSWCSSQCGSCGSGETCVTWTNTGPVAACLRECDTTADCESGSRCVAPMQVLGVAPAGKTFCVPEVGCPGMSLQCLAPFESDCNGANRLRRFFANATWCGYEEIDCPRGCARTSPDGGVVRASCL